jgi:hypothetical protein
MRKFLFYGLCALLLASTLTACGKNDDYDYNTYEPTTNIESDNDYTEYDLEVEDANDVTNDSELLDYDDNDEMEDVSTLAESVTETVSPPTTTPITAPQSTTNMSSPPVSASPPVANASTSQPTPPPEEPTLPPTLPEEPAPPLVLPEETTPPLPEPTPQPPTPPEQTTNPCRPECDGQRWPVGENEFGGWDYASCNNASRPW